MKKIFLITLTLLFFIACSCVCAEDNATDIASTVEEDSITVDDGTFTALQKKISDAPAGSTITLERDYAYNDGFDTEGIQIERDLTIEGNGHTLNGMSQSRIFQTVGAKTSSCTLVLNNINFRNGKGDLGGAIYSYESHYQSGSYDYGYNYWHITVSNCNFQSNTASSEGGAISATYLTVRNCKFISNTAGSDGGAVRAREDSSFEGCTFKSNAASSEGGAVSLNSPNSGRDYSFSNCAFESNRADDAGGAVYCWGGLSLDKCQFTSNDCKESGGAVNTAAGHLYVNDTSFEKNHAARDGGAIYYSNQIERWSGTTRRIVTFDNSIESSTFADNVADRKAGAIYGSQFYDNIIYFVKANKCTFANNKAGNDEKDIHGVNATDCTFLTATSIAASDVATVYNGNRYLVITLKDSDKKPVSGVRVNVALGGKNYQLTTDKNGKVKVSTNGLAPVRTYVARITFNGNDHYVKSSKSVNVVVKKATPKLTAAARSFKAKAAKKYSVALKTNQNKALKSAVVTIKVGRLTINARTNANGVAIFNLAKLTKKGNYRATLTFKGNSYYSKISRNVYIRIV